MTDERLTQELLECYTEHSNEDDPFQDGICYDCEHVLICQDYVRFLVGEGLIKLDFDLD